MLVAYVSGHGFGHSTRVGEVLRTLRARAPGLGLAVVTSAPEALYRAAIPGAFLFRPLECDVGLAQRGALVIDAEATVARWRAFAAGNAARVRAETEWLRQAGARLVLGDIPPLAFEAAAEAGLPAMALANFSWDWIYRHLARTHPALGAAAEAAAAAYRRAERLFQLPFAGDLSVFPRRETVPLVARRPRRGREEARRLLGLPKGPLVLLSFGGLGLPGFEARTLAGLRELHFVIEASAGDVPENVTAMGRERLEAHGLGYQELVGAADVAVTKPGYGIVSDAIGAGTRLVYTERGDFPEYPILVAEMARYLPSVHVSNEDLRAGRLEEPIRRVLEMPFPDPPRLDGAEVVAARLLELATAR
jgi:L-arabinokinase